MRVSMLLVYMPNKSVAKVGILLKIHKYINHK